MRPERALAHHAIALAPAAAGATVTGDEQLLAIALAGALAAMHALAEHVRGTTVQCALRDDAGRGVVVIQVTEQSVTVAAAHLARFFDPAWAERPGGYRAAVDVLAARRIVAMHGGHVEVAAAAGGGAVLTLSLPLSQS
jgi:C4-dicarboxylate-specific signal transduction histidine kinase